MIQNELNVTFAYSGIIIVPDDLVMMIEQVNLIFWVRVHLVRVCDLDLATRSSE